MRRFLVAYRWEVLLVIGMHAPLWGFWVLALQGPMDLDDLAYEFVLWTVAVLPWHPDPCEDTCPERRSHAQDSHPFIYARRPR